MLSRRHMLKTAASAGALALALKSPDRARAADETPDHTWLTYAVNVEMTWGRLPFLERLRNVKRAGFSHYEFWQWRPKEKELDAIVSLNHELGLVPVQFTASPKRFDQAITDPARFDEFVSDVKAAVAVAKKLNVKKLCVVAGEMVKGYSPEEQTQAVIKALKAGAGVVEPEGITLILEPLNVLVNHPNQLIVTSKQASEVLRAVGSPNVKMLFDIYHQQISEGNLSGNITQYKDLIGYFQLADHPGRHEPGTGEINYAHVLRLIHDLGYRDPIGLEMSAKSDPAEAFAAVRKVDAEARALKR